MRTTFWKGIGWVCVCAGGMTCATLQAEDATGDSTGETSLVVLEGEDSLFEKAAAAYEIGDIPTALKLLGVQDGSADKHLEVAQGLMTEGFGTLARAVLAEGERHHLDDARILTQTHAALSDPNFVLEPKKMVADADLDAVKYLGGGSTVSLRFQRKRVTFGAFKPNQEKNATYYRAEIAAWRLAAMLRVAFFIPRNTHVFLTHDDLDTLYARITDASQQKYRDENFSRLVFNTDPTFKEVLHGTLKTWLEEKARLPIESTHVWAPWLSLEPGLSKPLAELEDPAITHFAVADSRESQEEYDQLRKHLGQTTARALARQISDLLLFDYVVTNWDRFSTNPRYRGGNCHFAFGRIVALDNGASFWDIEHSVPLERLRGVHRFSRQTVRALRDLQRDKTLNALFPTPTENELARFNQFWRRRTRALEMIDALILRYGEHAVLSL